MENMIHTIDASNVDRYGFFCYKSKPKSGGYRQKREWLESCMAEGVRLKIIYEGTRSAGFIEYAPGEATWRVVLALVTTARPYIPLFCASLITCSSKRAP